MVLVHRPDPRRKPRVIFESTAGAACSYYSNVLPPYFLSDGRRTCGEHPDGPSIPDSAIVIVTQIDDGDPLEVGDCGLGAHPGSSEGSEKVPFLVAPSLKGVAKHL